MVKYARFNVITLLTICLSSCSLICAAEPTADEANAAVEAEFGKKLGPYLTQHCVRCHGVEKQEGDFRIDSLSHDVGGGPSVNKWLEVVEKINNDEMPPREEANRPTAELNNKIVAWIAEQVQHGEAARLARRERVSFHRLTREEYANTVYDLLGVHFDVADPTGLEEDTDWHGFERIGSVLTLSAAHVEKYFAAAEVILSEAYPDPKNVVERRISRRRAFDLRGGVTPEQRKEMEADGRADKVRVDMWPGHNTSGGHIIPGNGALKTGGDFKVRIQVSGLKPPGGRAPHLALYANKLDRMLFEQDIVAPEDQPTIVEFQTHLPAGGHGLVLTNDVPGPSILPRSGRSGQVPFFSLKQGRIPWQLKLTDEEGVPLYPFLIVDWIEWEGPIISEEAQQKRDSFLPADPSDLVQVRESLTHFVERAFRRPARPAEIERFVGLVESEVAAAEKPLAALKTAMFAVLCSSDFYYAVEGSPDSDAAKLNDWELASRLSYFLWSTMPDDELWDLARQGKLHEPIVLHEQAKRMLADPRSERFCQSFSRQWLQLKKVGMFTPDSKLYPNYDKYLEQSMIRETTEFFREVFEQNLTLREFLISNWTMLNPRLAMHYGMEIGNDDAFRRVTLQPDDHRGGLLTQASILSLTSDGTRHRPVHRGVWVMESIFGESPPPPPANVEPIEPNPVDSPKATVRMKLEAHKSSPNCAACHRRIDPLGLAFDNYDAIGRWRTTEKVQNGIGEDPVVDPSGTLRDGRSYANAREFQQLLVDDLDRFNATFVKNLATYALRRTMTVDDRKELQQLSLQTKAADFRLQDAVEALIVSELFQKR